MNALEVVAKARGEIGRGCVYRLGHGGMHPEADHPFDAAFFCDCSGFVAWCLGVSRKLDGDPWYKDQDGGWFETTAVFKDCGTPFGAVDGVAWGQAKPGMLVVWGDHEGHQGHIGVVSEIDDKGPARVVHCSSGNYRALGDAIAETDSGIFRRNDALVARVKWVDYD